MDDKADFSNDLLNTLEYEQTDLRVEKVLFCKNKYSIVEAQELNKRMGFTDFIVEQNDEYIIFYQVNHIEDVRIKKYNIETRNGVYLTKLLQRKI
jgi:hypothetical protein